jgi:hypothetical protein
VTHLTLFRGSLLLLVSFLALSPRGQTFHVTISHRSCPFWGIAPLSGGTDECAARRK